MMKKILQLFAVLLLLTGICACSRQPDLSGDWQLLRIDSEENPVTEEEMELVRSFGMDILLHLNADGTGTLDLFSEVSDLTYDTKEMKVTIAGYTSDMTYKDELLSIIEETGSMVFTRMKAE